MLLLKVSYTRVYTYMRAGEARFTTWPTTLHQASMYRSCHAAATPEAASGGSGSAIASQLKWSLGGARGTEAVDCGSQAAVSCTDPPVARRCASAGAALMPLVLGNMSSRRAAV